MIKEDLQKELDALRKEHQAVLLKLEQARAQLAVLTKTIKDLTS